MNLPTVFRRGLTKIATAGAMTGIRGYFLAGERVFPRRAAKSAVTMWMRIPAAPPAERRDRGVVGEERLDITVNGRPINAVAWGSGPVVLCAHGWSGWWQQYSVYVRPLLAQGFRVVAWDAPSHGDSAPGQYGAGRSGMPDLSDAIKAVAEQVGDGHVYGLIAHSGATLAAMNAMADGVRFDRLVFVSTSTSGAAQVSYFSKMLGWGPRTVEIASDQIAHDFEIDWDDWEMPERFEQLGLDLPPLLMLHHAHDRQTPLADAQRLGDIWPGSWLRVTDDYDHHRLLWAPWTVDQAVRFLRD